jgi:hypothetical protein
MRKAMSSEGDLTAMAAEMRPGFHDNCPSDALLNRMLELIFSGNVASAFRLYDLAWPGDSRIKHEFRSAFISRLRHSGYCRDFVRDGQLGGEPVKCEPFR